MASGAKSRTTGRTHGRTNQLCNATVQACQRRAVHTWVWYGLDDLCAAIAEMMTALNTRVMRRFGRSRRELYEEIDRPLLKALPAEPYVLAEWRCCKVGIDYHVEAAKHFYSVPYRMPGHIPLLSRHSAAGTRLRCRPCRRRVATRDRDRRA